MDQGHINKMPGQSQIEINGKIHTFTMREYSHPELHIIDQQIAKMQQEYPHIHILLSIFDLCTLKHFGFKPDTSWVLRHMTEQEKEDDLCYHSEKIAMAYGLLHTPPGATITITKNLRVCGNCHASTKLFSKIYLYFFFCKYCLLY